MFVWRDILKWRPELTAARVGLWALVVVLLIDSIAHPHYWGWWTAASRVHTSRVELVLAFLGLIAAAFDLHDMLTLETVWTTNGRRVRLWFPSKEIQKAVRSGRAVNLEDGSQLVSPETYDRLLREPVEVPDAS